MKKGLVIVCMKLLVVHKLLFQTSTKRIIVIFFKILKADLKVVW